jgi:hypothetical protein
VEDAQLSEAAQTPLLELLRAVPIDARLSVVTRDSEHMIPVGLHCHEAADRIEELEELVETLVDESGGEP